MPWESGISPLDVGIAYHGQVSGLKYVAPIVYNFIDDNGAATESGATTLANAIKARYLHKWEHLWNLYQSEYSPLDSYRVTETGTKTDSKSGSGTETRTPDLTTKDVLEENTTDAGESTSAIEHGEKVDNTSETTSTSNDFTFGFNTDAEGPAPSARTTGESSTTGSETHSGTDTTTGISSGTSSRDSTNTRTETGTDTKQRTSSESGNEQYSVTKLGNMNHSPADLMYADREFWYDDYFSIVFADIDKMLTLAIMPEYPITHFIF